MLHPTPPSLHTSGLVRILLLGTLLVSQVIVLPRTVQAQSTDQTKPIPVISVPPSTDTPPGSVASTPQSSSLDQGAATSPAPRIETSGAIGTPATFSMPPHPQEVSAPLAPSISDWSADLQEGFEHDLAAWQVIDVSNSGAMWGIADEQAHRGSHAVWVAADGSAVSDPASASYPPAMDTWLVSKNYLDLRGVQMADMQFSMRSDIAPDADHIFVGASVDGIHFAGAYWRGDSGGWQSYNLDLSSFVGAPQVYVGWYFHSDSTARTDNHYTGVWVDDVQIWTYTATGPARTEQKIHNGSFEAGDLSGWAMPISSTVMPLKAPNPGTGTYVAYFGGIAHAQEMLYQSVALPSEEIAAAQLMFQVNQFGTEAIPDGDRFCVSIANADMTVRLLDLGCMDGRTVSGSSFEPGRWSKVNYTLSGDRWNAIKGQTINVVFEMSTNDRDHTYVFLDDVNLEIVSGGTGGDAHEPDDTVSDAPLTRIGEPVTDLTIDPSDDQDVFLLSGEAGITVSVDIDAAINGSTLDSVVRLLKADGEQVCRNDDDGNSFDSYLVCRLPETGNYYVAVTSYDGRGNRSMFYNITIQMNTAVDGPAPDPSPTPPPPANPVRPWTTMLYLSGDNNLCPVYPELIGRMEQELGDKIGPDGFLNTVALFDRHPGYCSDQQGDTTRLLIQPGGTYQDNVNRWNMGELNMGDPQTLINFVTWAMHNYPAEHYYLAIDNHGNGLSGISWDYTNGHDRLTIPELHAALKQITDNGRNKLDVFAYEACLMGMYENAYDIHQFVDYIFFFETVSWTSNESYPSYLGDPRFTAATTGEELGKIMFEVYFTTVNAPYAVSLIDASQMEAVRLAVDDWSNMLQPMLSTSRDSIAQARKEAQKIDTNLNERLDEEDQSLDLWDLAKTMSAQGIAEPQSNAVKAAVEAAVLYSNAHSSGSQNYTNTHGLSIYWPNLTSGSYNPYISEQLYTVTRDGSWDEFLQAYRDQKRPDLPVDDGAADRWPVGKRDPFAHQGPLYLPIVVR